MKTFLMLGILVSVLFSGCGSLKPKDFADSGASLEPEKYFTGVTRSWGVLENRAGEPKRRFSTEIIGTPDETGDVNIRQTFTYEDGTTQLRLWHVHRIDAHRYEATANDVVGRARGQAYGNAFRWEYTLALKPGNPLSNVHFRQWMYLTPGTQTMFTRATITKVGFTVGEVAESFHHVSSTEN